MVIQQQMRYTSAEFEAFIALPENRERLFELIEGEIVEKVGSFIPSTIAIRIAFLLSIFLETHPIGYVTGSDGTYRLSSDNAPMPDVAYISKASLPEAPEREVDGPPDLAVEVKSPNDTKRELRLKAELYLRYGTKMVWLVFPDEQAVEVYVPNEDVILVGIDGTLDGREVLPDFILAVKEIFR